jgi:hypothetical protein
LLHLSAEEANFGVKIFIFPSDMALEDGRREERDYPRIDRRKAPLQFMVGTLLRALLLHQCESSTFATIHFPFFNI